MSRCYLQAGIIYILCWTGISAKAVEVFKEDFQEFQTASPQGINAKWAVISPAEQDDIVLSDAAEDGLRKKELVLRDNEPELTSYLVGTFQDTIENDGLLVCRVTLIPESGDKFSAFMQLRNNFESAVQLRFMGRNGKLELKQPEEFGWKELAQFEDGKSIRIEIVLNMAASSCDIRIDGETVASAEPLLSSISGINRIEFSTGIKGESQGKLILQSVEITSVK